jgi:hypothetical protein
MTHEDCAKVLPAIKITNSAYWSTPDDIIVL